MDVLSLINEFKKQMNIINHATATAVVVNIIEKFEAANSVPAPSLVKERLMMT